MIRKGLTIFLLLFISVVLYFTVSKITEQDTTESATYIFHTSDFIMKTSKETGMKNIVEAIVVNYRSMDTIGGLIIILTAIISVTSLLRSSFSDTVVSSNLMFDNIILKSIVILLLPLCLLFAFYLFFIGNSIPGGGFQGGLMLGATIIIMSFAFGCNEIESKLPLNKRVLIISSAFILVIFVGILGTFFGYNLFTYYFPDIFSESIANIISLSLRKIFSFSIFIIVGITVTSLFYFMAGDDV